MQKTSKEQAIKKLEAELKEEKRADFARSASLLLSVRPSLTIHTDGERLHKNVRRRLKSVKGWRKIRRRFGSVHFSQASSDLAI